MVKIPLTKGYYTVVDDEDAHLASYKWWAQVKPNSAVYACRDAYINGKWTTLRLHREIMNAPTGVEVDHIDGNGLNNCKNNLRLASRCENGHNSKLRVTNTTGYKGVDWHKRSQKFRARITLNSKLLHLGYFDTAEAAGAAYDQAAIELHGEFALTNAMLRERECECEKEVA